jgi:hypothetical protein
VSDQPGVCENCAREEDELIAVRRVYLDPETTMPDVELWCFSCRTSYPHEVVEDGGG